MRSKSLVLTLGLIGIVALACGGGDEKSEPAPSTPAKTTLDGSGTKADPYKASCDNNGKDLTGDVGNSFFVQCPGSCTSGSVWGVGPYTRDSRICTAAIHGGATNAGGGLVKVGIAAGASSYEGSESNGITSRSWGSYDTSITVASGTPKKAADPAPAAKPAPAPAPAPAAPSRGGGGGPKKGGGRGR